MSIRIHCDSCTAILAETPISPNRLPGYKWSEKAVLHRHATANGWTITTHYPTQHFCPQCRPSPGTNAHAAQS